MKFNNCYIRNKIGCHCTDSCGYEEAINQLEETKEPMSKEEGKPDINGFLNQVAFWQSAYEKSQKELSELKELLDLKKIYLEKAMTSHHEALDKNTDLESQLEKAKEYLDDALTFCGAMNPEYKEEIELFLKS